MSDDALGALVTKEANRRNTMIASLETPRSPYMRWRATLNGVQSFSVVILQDFSTAELRALMRAKTLKALEDESRRDRRHARERKLERRRRKREVLKKAKVKKDAELKMYRENLALEIRALDKRARHAAWVEKLMKTRKESKTVERMKMEDRSTRFSKLAAFQASRIAARNPNDEAITTVKVKVEEEEEDEEAMVAKYLAAMVAAARKKGVVVGDDAGVDDTSNHKAGGTSLLSFRKVLFKSRSVHFEKYWNVPLCMVWNGTRAVL